LGIIALRIMISKRMENIIIPLVKMI
jgi:hypothetical protein